MYPSRNNPDFDGTSGRSEESGRRTHVIRILRDSTEPVSVSQIAETVGIHINTARFHLESLVEDGLAARETSAKGIPGRPKILYVGTLPNQTHERAQGYRLLAEFLTKRISEVDPEAARNVYQIGRNWGRHLTPRYLAQKKLSEDKIMENLIEKLEALWFAPELIPGAETVILLHNSPFCDLAGENPEVVSALHDGLINGSLEELGSKDRVVQSESVSLQPYRFGATLGPA